MERIGEAHFKINCIWYISRLMLLDKTTVHSFRFYSDFILLWPLEFGKPPWSVCVERSVYLHVLNWLLFAAFFLDDSGDMFGIVSPLNLLSGWALLVMCFMSTDRVSCLCSRHWWVQHNSWHLWWRWMYKHSQQLLLQMSPWFLHLSWWYQVHRWVSLQGACMTWVDHLCDGHLSKQVWWGGHRISPLR